MIPGMRRSILVVVLKFWYAYIVTNITNLCKMEGMGELPGNSHLLCRIGFVGPYMVV